MTTKHKLPLDCLTWRKIILNKGEFERRPGMEGCWVRANPDEWNTITELVPKNEREIYGAPIYIDKGYRAYPGQQRKSWSDITIPTKNHPLVEKGIAYWMNHMYIITGYLLKSNINIYLPIFQIKKEKLNFKLRDEIRKYAKFIVGDFRQSLYKKTLMNITKINILPENIIDIIAHLTYDPIFYLKL